MKGERCSKTSQMAFKMEKKSGSTLTHVCNMAIGPLFIIDEINFSIAKARHNKAYVEKFTSITKRLSKVLNGADSLFIRQGEFYSDLKETLLKMQHHIAERGSQQKLIQKFMGKKDQKLFGEFECHVGQLITRIVFAFAQRVKTVHFEWWIIINLKKLQ